MTARRIPPGEARQPVHPRSPRSTEGAAMVAILSTDLMAFCKSCRKVTLSVPTGIGEERPYHCTECGCKPWQTPASENVVGRRFGTGVLAELGEETA